MYPQIDHPRKTVVVLTILTLTAILSIAILFSITLPCRWNANEPLNSIDYRNMTIGQSKEPRILLFWNDYSVGIRINCILDGSRIISNVIPPGDPFVAAFIDPQSEKSIAKCTISKEEGKGKVMVEEDSMSRNRVSYYHVRNDGVYGKVTVVTKWKF